MRSSHLQESTLTHGSQPSSDRAFREYEYSDGLGARALDWLRQALCGLHGHDSLLQFEKDRIFLKCVSCGHETPGWELTEPRSARITTTEMQPRPVVAPRLIRSRRIA
jgi:hypothetical protein